MRSKPRGQLIIIGGAEDKGESGENKMNRDSQELEILDEQLKLHKEEKYVIEVITTASNRPEDVKETYQKAFKKLGVNKVGFMHMTNNLEANDQANVARIEKANTVLFSGGNQFKLATILGCSKVVAALHEKYADDEDFVLAGTSAGAMVMPEIMMYEAPLYEAILKGSARLSSGFGFLNHCIIDTHFIRRGRFSRLAEALMMCPGCVGIGLGEDTALVIREGNKAVCKGSGMVVVLDGQHIGHTNIAYAEQMTPVSIENLVVHLLSRDCGFLLKERQFLPSPKDLKKEKQI